MFLPADLFAQKAHVYTEKVAQNHKMELKYSNISYCDIVFSWLCFIDLK